MFKKNKNYPVEAPREKSRSQKNACEAATYLQGFDIYSQSVNFTFRGREWHSTCAGTFFSFVTFVLMITLALNRTVKFLKHDNPFLSVMTDAVTDDRIDFGALDFMFAVQKPNPRVGKIKVLQQLKTGSNITGKKHKKRNPLSLHWSMFWQPRPKWKIWGSSLTWLQ